jgi:hypothetical protein
MESGKRAGERCVQLTDDNRCRLFDSSLRPAVCNSLQPCGEMCGTSADEAMRRITEWERLTLPKNG